MQIPAANLFIPLPVSLPKEQLLQNFKPGQILQATALSENQSGSVKLQIGVTRLIAQTQVAVKPGQPLTLQVEKTGDLPQLRLVTEPTREQQQASALKSVLPRQQPIPQLLDKLIQLTDSSQKTPLPAEIKQAFRSLLARLPSTENPDFRLQLKAAMQNSGLFAEARLQAGSIPSGDLKLNLLRLMRMLQATMTQLPAAKQSGVQAPEPSTNQEPAPGASMKLLNELFKQLDATLARIQTNQLASLPQDEPGRQIWQFELPVMHGASIDPLQILIKKELSRDPDAQANIWSLTLQINLHPLGPMRIQLTFQEDTISTIICAEQARTTDLVQAHLAVLHKAYEAAGLEVNQLETYRGRVETRDPMPSDLSLLSEKA